jgi:hypothetical protein
LKVVYELITENDKKFEGDITKEELEEIRQWAENSMNELLQDLLKSKETNYKLTVKCKGISDY